MMFYLPSFKRMLLVMFDIDIDVIAMWGNDEGGVEVDNR